MVIAGDSASMVNIPKLKGVHLAMHAGMFAAEAIFERLKSGDTSDLSNYQDKVEESVIEKDMHRSRNMRQPFAKGFLVGGALANAMEISGGRFPPGVQFHTHDDAAVDVFVGNRDKSYPKPDGKYTFDKLSSVFATGNATRDDAPNHIRIQKHVPLELALMWRNMCPAQVYELPTTCSRRCRTGARSWPARRSTCRSRRRTACSAGPSPPKGGRLTPPEGGDGPNYQIT